MRPLPPYALIGLAIILVSEAAMLFQVEPFWSWHTPIAWSGYILLVDGLVWQRRGSSWLKSARPEFAFLACMSVPLWLVFEFYNLFIENWRYVNLPPNAVLRSLGYGWSFATIWPAIFETSELLGSARPSSRRDEPSRRPVGPSVLHIGGPVRVASVLAGAALLVWPLVWPSPYLAAPVWLGFILLLDPLNARIGAESLIRDARSGDWRRLGNLAVAGLVCGLLWEFWNYWARAKWVYSVPILSELKIFEMPVTGYLGFPVFALECFTMYVFLRQLLWRGRTRPVGL